LALSESSSISLERSGIRIQDDLELRLTIEDSRTLELTVTLDCELIRTDVTNRKTRYNANGVRFCISTVTIRINLCSKSISITEQ